LTKSKKREITVKGEEDGLRLRKRAGSERKGGAIIFSFHGKTKKVRGKRRRDRVGGRA